MAGKRATLVNANEKAGTAFSAACAPASTSAVMRSGDMKGTSTVICAGTPSFTDASKRSRNAPTRLSASGTRTMKADCAGFAKAATASPALPMNDGS